MANEQDREKFESEDNEMTSQSGQERSSAQQGQNIQSDVSDGTLGKGQSGGFGNQTSGSPEMGQQDRQSSSGQPSTAESGQGLGSGDTALDTRTESQFGQGQSSQSNQAGDTGQQSGNFVGSQAGGGSDQYLRDNENQETAQRSSSDESDSDGPTGK